MRTILLLLAAVLTAGCTPATLYLGGSLPQTCAQALPRGQSPCSAAVVR